MVKLILYTVGTQAAFVALERLADLCVIVQNLVQSQRKSVLESIF